MYSAMKISAKRPAEYSVLNPDTNSLSPSAKSNGVRFVSAKSVTNHTKNKIGKNKATEDKELKNINWKSNLLIKIKLAIRIKDILTS